NEMEFFMKPILLFAAGIISLLVGCVPTSYMTLPESQHTYAKVFTVEGANHQDIHSKVRQWLALNVGDSTEVVRLDNAQGGVLVAKVILPNGLKDSMGVRHDLYLTIRFESKDGRYRYTASD